MTTIDVDQNVSIYSRIASVLVDRVYTGANAGLLQDESVSLPTFLTRNYLYGSKIMFLNLKIINFFFSINETLPLLKLSRVAIKLKSPTMNPKLRPI